MSLRVPGLAMAALCATGTFAVPGHSAARLQDEVKGIVDGAVLPAMRKYDVPGMAVGIVAGGRGYVFDYGVASLETRKPVTRDTLFELGSVSKTFTATLASYAQVSGLLNLSDKTSKYLPWLRGCKFGDVSLLQLGTHTPGGMPLQIPETITNSDQLMAYLEAWRPVYAPGTHRTYANPSIGMLGLIAAKSMNQDFTVLMEQRLFPSLGMKRTYIDVPKARMASYAQGYTSRGMPVRMAEAVLSAEAYGVKTTAGDMVRFLEANMGLAKLDANLQSAITQTHTGYFRAGEMTQDLIWEQYPYPVELKTLLAGNSPAVIFGALPVTRMNPPQEPRIDVLINKTGSTNGFSAYVAFIPARQLGIVILANRNYPIDARVTMAHRMILESERVVSSSQERDE
jgi:beta-lactamase class C